MNNIDIKELAKKINVVSPKDFDELLQAIEKNPFLFLPRYSIFSFQSFLHGYQIARRQFNIPESQREKELPNFFEWMRKKYQIETGQSWASILLFYSRDEKDALDLFFKLFKEFQQQKKVREK